MTVFEITIGIQVLEVLFLALHDWLPLGRLTNLAAVHAADTRKALVWTTIWSTLPFAFGLGWSLFTLAHGRSPAGPRTYLLVSYGLLLAGALQSWWVPYFFGASPQKRARFRARFADTIGFLPTRNGIRPDAIHVVFHTSLVVLLVLLWRM